MLDNKKVFIIPQINGVYGEKVMVPRVMKKLDEVLKTVAIWPVASQETDGAGIVNTYELPIGIKFSDNPILMFWLKASDAELVYEGSYDATESDTYTIECHKKLKKLLSKQFTFS